MISPEVTNNVYVAPASGLWMLPGESLKRDVEKVTSDAIIATRQILDSAQHYAGKETLSGTLPLELSDVGSENALRMLLGAPVVTGGGPTYTRTWAGLLDVFNVSSTMQVGRPDNAGAIVPFTWTGVKAISGALGLTESKPVTLNLEVVAQNETLYRSVSDAATNTNTAFTSVTAAFTPDDVGKPISGTSIPAATTIAAYVSTTAVTLSQAATGTGTGQDAVIGVAAATAAYTASMKPFTFVGGSVTNNSVTIGGAAPPAVKQATLTINRPQDTERRSLGSARILQPIVNDLASVKLELDCEFDGTTHYKRYIADSEHAVVLSLVSPAAHTLTFTMTGRYEMNPEPTVADRGVLRQKIALDMSGTTDAAAFTAVLVNSIA